MVGCLIKTRWRNEDSLLMCRHFLVSWKTCSRLIGDLTYALQYQTRETGVLIGWWDDIVSNYTPVYPQKPYSNVIDTLIHLVYIPVYHGTPTWHWSSDDLVAFIFRSFQVHRVPRCDIPKWTRCSGAAANIKRPEKKREVTNGDQRKHNALSNTKDGTNTGIWQKLHWNFRKK